MISCYMSTWLMHEHSTIHEQLIVLWFRKQMQMDVMDSFFMLHFPDRGLHLFHRAVSLAMAAGYGRGRRVRFRVVIRSSRVVVVVITFI